MPENGDELGKEMFDQISFGDDLNIESANLEIDDLPKDDVTTKVDEKKDEEEKPGSDAKTTETTKTDPKEDELINFDEPVSTDESSDDATASDSDSSSSTSSPISSIVTALSAEGLIDVTDEELENVEDYADFLRTKLNDEVDKRAKTNFSDAKLKALEAFEAGVPMKEFVNSNARETEYSKITNEQITENEQWQEILVSRSLAARGFSEEEILDEIKTYKDVGNDKLKTKAIAARDILVKFERQQRDKMLAEAEETKEADNKKREDQLSSIKDYVTSQKEIIPNLPVTDKDKEDLYKIMTTPIAKDSNGNPINAIGKAKEEDPTRFNMLMTYYYKLGLFNETPDLSKLQKVAETKVARGLDKLVGNDTGFLDSGKNKNAKPNEDLGLEFVN